MRFTQEIIFIIIIAIYGFIITKYIPKKFYSFVNLIVSFGAVCYGLFYGLSFEKLGLTANYILKGVPFGLIIGLLISVVILLMTSQKKLRKLFSSTTKNKYNTKTFFYELCFRIPFGTALSEEVIFRSVLLAILLSNHTRVTAIIASAILFGLWHIFPTLHTIKDHDPLAEMMDNSTKRNFVAVIITIISTSFAGIIFAVLAIITGSFIASWIVHASINGFATLGGYLSVWYDNRHTN